MSYHLILSKHGSKQSRAPPDSREPYCRRWSAVPEPLVLRSGKRVLPHPAQDQTVPRHWRRLPSEILVQPARCLAGHSLGMNLVW